MKSSKPISAWDRAYAAWQQDCLDQWNRDHEDPRVLYDGQNCDPGLLIEFSDNGHAYPHGSGGTSCVPSAVTPWNDSRHFLP